MLDASRFYSQGDARYPQAGQMLARIYIYCQYTVYIYTSSTLVYYIHISICIHRTSGQSESESITMSSSGLSLRFFITR